jgi:ABC-type glycerol-3-phosphate transport system substrate-binding protein
VIRWLRLVLFALLAAVGCGSPAAPTGDPSKKVTWEQFQKMPPEEQADPYVLNNLDDNARKKLDEMLKKPPKK